MQEFYHGGGLHFSQWNLAPSLEPENPLENKDFTDLVSFSFYYS